MMGEERLDRRAQRTVVATGAIQKGVAFGWSGLFESFQEQLPLPRTGWLICRFHGGLCSIARKTPDKPAKLSSTRRATYRGRPATISFRSQALAKVQSRSRDRLGTAKTAAASGLDK